MGREMKQQESWKYAILKCVQGINFWQGTNQSCKKQIKKLGTTPLRWLALFGFLKWRVKKQDMTDVRIARGKDSWRSQGFGGGWGKKIQQSSPLKSNDDEAFPLLFKVLWELRDELSLSLLSAILLPLCRNFRASPRTFYPWRTPNLKC